MYKITLPSGDNTLMPSMLTRKETNIRAWEGFYRGIQNNQMADINEYTKLQSHFGELAIRPTTSWFGWPSDLAGSLVPRLFGGETVCTCTKIQQVTRAKLASSCNLGYQPSSWHIWQHPHRTGASSSPWLARSPSPSLLASPLFQASVSPGIWKQFWRMHKRCVPGSFILSQRAWGRG